MYLLDSNIYVWYCLADDALHHKVLTILEDLDPNKKIVVPYSILSETLTVLTYKWGKEMARDFVTLLEEDDRFVFRKEKENETFDFWLQVDKKIWYTDIAIVYISTSMWLQLISLDKQVMSLYKEFLW